MMYRALLVAVLLAPSLTLAAPLELRLSKSATVEGSKVPVQATVSASTSDVELSATKQAGSVPVTITFFLTPKPKPVAPSPQPAAVVGSSQSIQNGIASLSPSAAAAVAPFFKLVDGGRGAAAQALEGQLDNTKKSLGPEAGNPGAVLSAESDKSATSDPMGVLWRILQTLYFYLLTILLFLVSNAAVFYPLLALLFFYVLWHLIRRFRRPAY